MILGLIFGGHGIDAQRYAGVLPFFFQDISYPRAANVRFGVGDIFAMALMAVVSGANEWAMVAAYTLSRATLLRGAPA